MAVTDDKAGRPTWGDHSLRRLCEEATPGPWVWDSYSTIFFANCERGSLLDESRICDGSFEECEHPEGQDYRYTTGACGYPTPEEPYQLIASLANVPGTQGDELHHPQLKANAVFIVAARDALPALLDRVEMLERDRLMLAERCDALRAMRDALSAQLSAYRDTVFLRPHQMMAVRDSTEPVPMPTPESLANLLDEREKLRAERTKLLDELGARQRRRNESEIHLTDFDDA